MVYRLVWVLLLVGIMAGCRDRMADQLQGRWIGQPDTAAAREAREAWRYQDPVSQQERKGPQDSADRQVLVESPAVGQSDSQVADQGSDWERYDVRILLEFVRGQRVNMSLADGSESRSGVWRVVHQTPIGLVIEIETRASGQEEGQEIPALNVADSQRRRFELQFDYDHRSAGGRRYVGFRLVESGADPRLGAIYFKREKSS